MREVLSRFEETEEVVAVSEARIEPVAEELAFPKLDGVLFPMVVANADVVAPCPWMGGAEVSLSEALNNYYQLMSEENADTVIADVNDFLANQVRPVVTTEEVKPETEIKSEIETSGSPKPEAFTETVNDFALKPATEAEAVQAKEAELEKQPVVEQEPAKYAEYTSVEQPDPIKEAVTGHEVAISDREDVISVIEKPEVDDGRDVTAEKASGLNRETFEPEDVFYVPRHDSAPEVREQATREEAGLTDGAGAVEVHAEPLNNMTVVVGEESVNIETDERLIQDEEFETEPAEKVIIPQRGEPEGIEPKPKNRLDLSEVVENEIVELEVDESLVAPQEIRIKEMEAEADVNLPLAREADKAESNSDMPISEPVRVEDEPETLIFNPDNNENIVAKELVEDTKVATTEDSLAVGGGEISDNVPCELKISPTSEITQNDEIDAIDEVGEVEQIQSAVENISMLMVSLEDDAETPIMKVIDNLAVADEADRTDYADIHEELRETYAELLEDLQIEYSLELIDLLSTLTVELQSEDEEIDIFKVFGEMDEDDLQAVLRRRSQGSSTIISAIKDTLTRAKVIGRSALKLCRMSGVRRLHTAA